MAKNVEIVRNGPRVTFAPTPLVNFGNKPTSMFPPISNDHIDRHLQSMLKVKLENDNSGDVISTDSDKENGLAKSALKCGNNKKLMSAVDYRLVHHLHVQFRNIADSSTDIWDLVTKNYNFLTYSAYTKEEIQQIWNKFPAMEKRKLMIESYSSVPDSDCEVSANKKAKKGKKSNAIRSFEETSKEKLALAQSNGGKSTADKWHATSCNLANVVANSTSRCTSIDNHRQPYDSSTGRDTKDKRLPSISPQASVSKQVCAVNKIDQCTQTDKDVNDLENLAKEELRLKIDILKLRLNYMKKQYARQCNN